MEAQIGQFREEWSRTNSRIVSVFTLLILAGLPIVFQDYYFNILVVKYYYYCAMVIGMAVFTAIAAVIYIRRDRLLYGGGGMENDRRGGKRSGLEGGEWGGSGFSVLEGVFYLQSECKY